MKTSKTQTDRIDNEVRFEVEVSVPTDKNGK